MTEAPAGARNFVLITLDSCRYDAFERAHAPNLRALGEVQRRFSYSSWTPPSHHAMLAGLLPHSSPRHAHASACYIHEFREHERRLRFTVKAPGRECTCSIPPARSTATSTATSSCRASTISAR
jgi:hypothetical protein